MQRKLSVILFFVFAVVNAQLAKTAEIASIPKNVLDKFSVREDKFQKATFVDQKTFFQNFRFYIVFKDGVATPRWSTTYMGKDWIFLQEVIFIIDGLTYSYNVAETKRTVSESAMVYETSDQVIDENLFKIALAIVNSKNKIDVRFSGSQSHYDTKFSKKEIRRMAETLALYNSL